MFKTNKSNCSSFFQLKKTLNIKLQLLPKTLLKWTLTYCILDWKSSVVIGDPYKWICHLFRNPLAYLWLLSGKVISFQCEFNQWGIKSLLQWLVWKWNTEKLFKLKNIIIYQHMFKDMTWLYSNELEIFKTRALLKWSRTRTQDHSVEINLYWV